MPLAKIRNCYNEMSRAEKRTAEYILDNPKKILDLTISQLAKKSETSDATVIRMCRHIGYSGFSQMKIALAGSLAMDTKPQMEGYLIGIDVGGTNIKIMIMSARFEVIAKRIIHTRAEEGYETISDRIIENLDEMFAEKDIISPSVLAVGMGVPGMVDKDKNETVYLSVLHWDGFNPAKKIGNYYKAPCCLDNDANINALGEYAFGDNENSDNMVLVTLGTGVGCGVIINGKIYSGASNMASELGHMIVDARDGDICLCGRRGHLEAYCSGSALKRDALYMMSVNSNTALHKYMDQCGGVFDNTFVTRGAKEGDPVCVKLLDRYVHYLSVGIANVMMLFNPGIILIGGGISGAGEILFDSLNSKTKELLTQERSWCPIKAASLGAEAGMYGACALAGQLIGL